MAEEEDDEHHELVDDGYLWAHLDGEAVEDTAEHAACQAEGEEADV